MLIDLAPMEGITTFVFRKNFHKYFGGIHRCYTPFLSSLHLSTQQKNEVLPEHNEGMTVIPQILTNRTDEFLEISKALQEYGYTTVNFNLGCPSGTVVSKHRGSGFLNVPLQLEQFLDEVFEKCPLKISIKTRIGFEDEEEWESLLRLYEKYPLDELIVHTRLRSDLYKLPARPEMILPVRNALEAGSFHRADPGDTHPFLCYNGDITSKESLDRVRAIDPLCDRIMVGRGLISDFNLIRRLTDEPLLEKSVYADFLHDLMHDYIDLMQGSDRNVLYKMKEIWVYLGDSFTDSRPFVKKIKKSNRLSEYEAAAKELFAHCELR